MRAATALNADGQPLRRAGGPARSRARRSRAASLLQALFYYAVLAQLVAFYCGLPVGVADLARPLGSALWRWRTGGDADGWLPCDGRCGWGEQRRVVDGREQRRRCYGAGYVAADGECIMAPQ
jgi:hypothetical protein